VQNPLKVKVANVNIGGRFFVVNAAMSQISAHPLVWAQSKLQRPWALFRETTVRVFVSTFSFRNGFCSQCFFL